MHHTARNRSWRIFIRVRYENALQICWQEKHIKI